MVVVYIVVAVPEGLPMTIGISLAFSVMKMYKDGILVRKLGAPEQLGACDEILSGKTGTLTKNDMKVSYFVLEGNKIKNSRKDTFMNCELAPETIELIKASILYNCSAQVEMKGTQYVPSGNGTEVGLLKFLQDGGVPVHLLIQNRLGNVRATIPFSSDVKISACAIEDPDRKDSISIYIKGAPEEIMRLCKQALVEGGLCNMSDNAQHAQEVISIEKDFDMKINEMSQDALRCIAFGYFQMNLNDWKRGEKESTSPSNYLKELVDTGKLPFILLGGFALRDQLRPTVKSAVKHARQEGSMSIRLVSGDHIETARKVA